MKPYCVFICFVLYVYLNTAEEISFDYFFGKTALRSEESVETLCKNTLYEYSCISNCPRDHVCFMLNSLCVDIGVDENVFKKPLPYQRSYLFEEESEEGKSPPGFIDLTKTSGGRPYSYNYHPERSGPYEDYPAKPVLRHHIAHFCPNLDIARECIRKCMPLGKPAFCGKDHVCYCGHNYDKMPKNKEKQNDAIAIYAQFKDLYKKYFGDKYYGNTETTTQHISSSSSEED